MENGKIIKGIAGFYYVHTAESGVYACKAKGIFRKKKIKPLVGDDVIFEITDPVDREGNIMEILPRRNALIRPAAANVDQALVIFAVTQPEPNLNLLDRFLVSMEKMGVDALICFNKCDLAGVSDPAEYNRYEGSDCQKSGLSDGKTGNSVQKAEAGDGKAAPEICEGKTGDGKTASEIREGKAGDGKTAPEIREGKAGDGKAASGICGAEAEDAKAASGIHQLEDLQSIYRHTGYRLLFTSADQKQGIEELRRQLEGKTTVVAGPSGVGKSSLINLLSPDVRMETGEISKKIERGKNTTRHAQLIRIGTDSYIMDTPGFTSLSIDELEKEELSGLFPEFRDYEDQCRFTGCSHVKEPDCAVKEALQEGKISPMRYEHYCAFYEELLQKKKY